MLQATDTNYQRTITAVDGVCLQFGLKVPVWSNLQLVSSFGRSHIWQYSWPGWVVHHVRRHQVHRQISLWFVKDPVCVQFSPSLPLVARLFKDSERYGLAFKDVLQPVQALPFEMSDLMIAHRAIPLRCSNRQAAGSSAVVPLHRNAGPNQFNPYQIRYQMGTVSLNCLNGNDINLQLLPPLANYRADPPSTPAALALQNIQPIATSIIQSGNEQSNNVEQNKWKAGGSN